MAEAPPAILWNQTNNSYVFPSKRRRHSHCSESIHRRQQTAVLFGLRGRQIGKGTAGYLKHRVGDASRASVDCAEADAAVGRQAQAEGVADHCSEDELRARIGAHIWEPSYRNYRKLV